MGWGCLGWAGYCRVGGAEVHIDTHINEQIYLRYKAYNRVNTIRHKYPSNKIGGRHMGPIRFTHSPPYGEPHHTHTVFFKLASCGYDVD